MSKLNDDDDDESPILTKFFSENRQTLLKENPAASGHCPNAAFCMYSAQRKWRNGENNRTLTVALFLTLNLTLNDYFRRCAICVAPNTDSLLMLLWPAVRSAREDLSNGKCHVYVRNSRNKRMFHS